MRTLDLSHIKLFFFDMDGTIYLGDQLLPGAKALFEQLHQQQVPYYFYTNNSSRSQSFYLKKLSQLGIAANRQQIFTSSLDTIKWLNAMEISRCYLMGTPLMQEEFGSYGIRHSKEQPELVVLSYDTTIDYEKIAEVSYFLQQGVQCIMTHPDVGCPTKKGLRPDVGSFLAMFKQLSTVEPIRIFGKPTPDNVLQMQGRLGCKKHEVVVIGDRLETDVQMALNAHVSSVLVLSGVTELCDYEKQAIHADHVINSIADIRLT